MTISRQNERHNFSVAKFIHQPMLLCDSSAPQTSAIARKRHWLTSVCARMLHEFINKFYQLLERSWIALTKHSNAFLCLFGIDDIKKL